MLQGDRLYSTELLPLADSRPCGEFDGGAENPNVLRPNQGHVGFLDLVSGGFEHGLFTDGRSRRGCLGLESQRDILCLDTQGVKIIFFQSRRQAADPI